MITVHNLALGASLLAVLGGGGVTLTTAPAAPTIRIIQAPEVASAYVRTDSSCTGTSTTLAQSASWSTTTPWASSAPFAKGTVCKCGHKCPTPPPPASCGPGQKVCKVRTTCNFNIVCDGTIRTCSVPIIVEVCSPNGNCGKKKP